MAVHVIDALEFIETFNFRGLCSIAIPKKVRERAVDLAIDIEIVSVARQQYLSYSSMPANGSYGYAVIVLQDFCEIEIELSQARQRIYLWHSAEAYDTRYAVELFDLSLVAERATQEILCRLMPLVLCACEVQPNPSIPKVFWKETPIKEIYVKTHHGTTFRVEISHNKFAPYMMLSTGDILDMKSGWSDGEKDGGLPISGSQPQIANDPNDPYSGFPVPSTNDELDDYANAKIDFADNPNSDNVPIPLSHFLQIDAHKWIYDNSGTTVEGYLYYPAQSGDYIVVNIVSPIQSLPSSCGAISYNQIEIYNNRGIRLIPIQISLPVGVSVNATNITALTQPPNSAILVPNGVCL